MPGPSPVVTAGHRRAVAQLEDARAAVLTIASFTDRIGAPVYLRPVSAGLRVMSLDAARCASMISVGGANGGLLRSLPPDDADVDVMVADYLAKRDGLQRASAEERFVLKRIAEAMTNGLELAGAGWWFVAHEWRLPISNGSTGKIDVLALDPHRRRLVVIECKASADAATRPDPNGWDAARQADEYSDAIWRERLELYPFFDQLVAAQAAIYRPDDQPPSGLDPDSAPTTAVWWPDPGGDHTPSWPAWNARELQVESDDLRRARYRRHQSWWRESVLDVGPGPHPSDADRQIGSMLDPAAVAADRRLNFIDEAAYRHAERRAREVVIEGGTLDPHRLFGNLLSSMPMCFNLFAAIGSAARFVDLVRDVFDSDAAEIDDVICEAPSPSAWTDRTAFDARIDYRPRTGGRRFVGIETKYTEPFTQARYDRADYRSITDATGWFTPDAADTLVGATTNQLWRGLLLAHVTAAAAGADARYAVISTDDDTAAARAVEQTRGLMVPAAQYRLAHVTLTDIISAARSIDDRRIGCWADAFAERYTPQP